VGAGSRHVDHRGSVAVVEAEGAGSQLNHDSSHAPGPVALQALGLLTQALVQALAPPTVGLGERQHQQLDTVGDAHPEVRVRYAGWAFLWVGHRCGVGSAEP